MKITLDVRKATVLISNSAPDNICLHLNLTTAFPEMEFEPVARIEARGDYGEQWCKEVLGIVPEIIDLRADHEKALQQLKNKKAPKRK